MSTFRIDFDHRDLVKMYKTLDRIGAAPQKALAKGTSKAATVTKRSIKRLAPQGSSHALRWAITTRSERSRKRGKKVREVTFQGGDVNAVLQRPIRNPGKYGGTSARAYYPASQEYGWLTGDSRGGVKYVEGSHYMRRGAEAVSEQAKDAMIETTTKELDKIWKSTTG